MASGSDAMPAVSATAIGVAAIRAGHSASDAPLFVDPLAARFVATAGWQRPSLDDPGRRERARQTVEWVVTRTVFLDDVVLRAARDGIDQLVLLAAGLDARAFRLDLAAQTTIFELDLPDVLALKEQVVAEAGLEPHGTRVIVPVDLTGEWPAALRAHGFDPSRPAVFVAEGLLAYLRAEDADALLADAAFLAVSGSRLGLTLASATRRQTWLDAHPEERNRPDDDPDAHLALFRSSAPDDVTAWLASLGWDASVHSAAEMASAYGRPLIDDRPEAQRGRLVDATRR